MWSQICDLKMGAPNPRPTMQEPSPCHWPHVDATLRNPSLLVSQSKYEQPVFASVEHKLRYKNGTNLAKL